MHQCLPADLRILYDKVLSGERLSADDGIRVLTHPDLFAVGVLADTARRLRVGDYVYFNNNAHINYSNVCVLWNVCKFCAFGKQSGDPEGYTYSIDEMVDKARKYARLGVTEIHMVGGLHPDVPWDYYIGFLSAIKAALPEVHLKCFTAIEIDWLARKFRKSVDQVLDELQAAGHGSITGGGAEMMAADVHDAICRGKMPAERYLDVHRIAHGKGIRSNCTMLYGHVEGPEHIVDHLLRLRGLQDETGGFQCFVPLAFHPANTAMSDLPGPTGRLDLKLMAAARLLLDNFKYIKAYWIMISPRLAQISLAFGANDVDGTVREEKIYHMAGATTPMLQSEQELVGLIQRLGRMPAERDTYYNVLRTYPAGTQLAEATS